MDPVAVLSALGVDRPDRVTPVSGGWDTALWRVAAAGRTYALRVFRSDQAATCRREALVMRTLRQQVPVPDVYAEGSWHDRPALLLAWCAGTTLLSAVRAQPWRVWQLGVAMGRIHAQIHAAPIPDWLADALPSISATDMRASILHLDYHPLNIMCTRQGISGVLDWANAAQGDRRADLARTITLLRLAPAPPRSPALLLSVLRRLLEAAWRSGYCQLHPADAFDHLEPFYAWAGDWMERDLRPKLGRPGVWLTERDLDRIHRWTLAHARS